MIEIIHLALIDLFGVLLVDIHCASTLEFLDMVLEELCVSLEGAADFNHAPSMNRYVTDATLIGYIASVILFLNSSNHLCKYGVFK